MSEMGKKQYDKNYEQLALRKIEKSGHKFLTGFYYYLLTNMTYTSAWNYVYKAIRFLDEEEITDPSEIKLENYVRHLASLKDYSSSNRITSYAAMKKLSKYLYANELNSKDYMQFVERPKPIETQEQIDKRENGFLTKRQCANAFRMVNESNDPDWQKARDKAILAVFLGTGIRRAALYKLDVKDFNFDDNSITVAEKGDKNRKIYCPESTIVSVKEWFQYRDTMVTNEPAAFISKRHNRLSTTSIVHMVEKYTGKTPHKLRGTFGTELYAKTKDLYLTQECMGHASPKTTEIYIRGQKNTASQKAAILMGNFLGNIIDDE